MLPVENIPSTDHPSAVESTPRSACGLLSSPLTQEDREDFRALVRDFTAKEISPNIDVWEAEGEIPRELYLKAGDIGLLGIGLPEQYGGLGPDTAMLRFTLGQELARAGSGGLVNALVGSFYISQPPIARLGSVALRARILPETISGRLIGALAVTEPGGGSDVAALSTTAVRDGDPYVVNGSKTLITSGMRADVITVGVRTGGPGAGGLSMLVVDGDTPGLTRTSISKMGWRCSDTATLYFDDCRVPVGNLLGEENQGFLAIATNFNDERMDLIAQAVAFSRLCLDRAIAYARERHTFGRRLADHQVLRHKIVDMAGRINACQAWAETLAWRLCQGESPVAEICQAKVLASRTFEFCAREAAQILGGASYVTGELIERLYREVRVQAIGGGSEEIMTDLAARQMQL
ncbi:MAG: acyl-CoA dehydrogenase [Pseudonocardiales bacterium]|nr:acyl-CoA dehydrogenase [Pseudonocardiales bacterium]